MKNNEALIPFGGLVKGCVSTVLTGFLSEVVETGFIFNFLLKKAIILKEMLFAM